MTPRAFTVISAVLTVGVFGASGGLLGPLLPAIGREFGVPLEVAGLLLSIVFAGAILAAIGAGVLADRFGKKLLYLLALAGLISAFLLFAAAPSFPVVAIACLLAGATGGALEGLCGAIIADLAPASVDRNMNLLQVTFCLGAVLALLGTAWLRGHDIDWRAPFAALAVAAGLSWLIGAFMYVRPVHHDDLINMAKLRRVIVDRAVLLLALAICLYVGSEMSLASWISPILQKYHGYPEHVAVISAALFWVAMGVGRVISGVLCHYIPAALVLRWQVAGGLAAYALLLAPIGTWRFWAGAGVAGLTFSGVWPLLVSLASARFPRYSGTMVSLLVTSGTVGGMAFSSLSGFVIERASPAWGLGLMAGLFAGLAVAVWRFAHRYHRAAQAAAATG